MLGRCSYAEIKIFRKLSYCFACISFNQRLQLIIINLSFRPTTLFTFEPNVKRSEIFNPMSHCAFISSVQLKCSIDITGCIETKFVLVEEIGSKIKIFRYENVTKLKLKLVIGQKRAHFKL